MTVRARTPFCKWHITTKENPAGTDCSAHLDDGRCFACPYPDAPASQAGKYPCMDYEPIAEETPAEVQRPLEASFNTLRTSDLALAIEFLFNQGWLSPLQIRDLRDNFKKEITEKGIQALAWPKK